MKNITKSLLFLLGIFAVSCTSDDVEDRPVIQQGTGLELQAPVNGAAYTLLIENQALQAERFVWTEADFGQDVVVTYTVEIDKAGDNFDTPQSLGAVPSVTQLSVSTASLNSTTLNLDGEPGVAANYDIRVKATINDTFAPLYSNSIQISVTPYALFVPVQDLYLVGEATEHGWSENNNNAPLFRDPENQFKYYFTGYFTAGGFKILSQRGNWNPQYGSAGAGILGVSNADGSNSPDVIAVPSAGYYQLTIDTDLMTYSLEPYNASAAPTFTSVGIIGDGTPGGWGADTDLTNTAAQPHLWRLSAIDLTEAKIKFRANDSWDLPGNWGGGATPIQGVTQVNGPDFQAVFLAGNYEVWFNDLDGRYIFIEN